MLDQKAFDLISECYTYSDKKAHEASKRYTDKRLSEELARLSRRIETLEDFLTRPKG